ncbi:hypothetical protein FOMPIDRAFT_1113613 [Fomitopsis schrenkii]|uniref:Uncharacterized protein n=1 Tax=Fomitopsis schrenkii TaxID=2126942 RepID=S8ELW8_FOMSC|nr:hypothetical protein FOMPIDRAFT_1113613 [Fomitopsis schrenkii]
MGSLCSKSAHALGGRTLADEPVQGASGNSAPPPGPNPRTAAAEAAERRRQAEQSRGTQSSNPNRGQLAAQLEANKKAPRVPEATQEERLVVRSDISVPGFEG